jgi:hypothetical protein
LQQAMQEWHIEEKVAAFVTDNAANVQKAIRLLGTERHPCVLHALQNTVRRCIPVGDGERAQRTVSDIICKQKRIVGHFNHSKKANDMWLEACAEAGSQSTMRPKQSCPTRWEMLPAVCFVLRPFRELTRLFSSGTLLSSVYPKVIG